MNLHDELRDELQRRAAGIPVDAAGPERAIAVGRARLRRTRIAAGVVVAGLIVGVGGTAFVLRGDNDSTSTSATGSDVRTSGELDDAPAQDDTDAPNDAPDPSATDAGDGELATTEPGDSAPVAAADTPAPKGPDEAAGDATDADPETTDATTDEPSQAAVETSVPEVPAAIDMVGHRGGYVAQRGGGALWWSADGIGWSPMGDPRPGPGSVSAITSHEGTLYVAGAALVDGLERPWISSTQDLRSWTAVAVPEAPQDGSALTDARHVIYEVAAGTDGIAVTGETIVDLDVEAIVGTDVFERGAWSLGDSSGDLSALLIYDDNGDVVDRIDLLAAGVPAASLDAISSGAAQPFVAAGNPNLTIRDAALPAGTVLDAIGHTGGDLVASGFSREFAGRILWSSPDGSDWEPIPVSVVSNGRAVTFGTVGGRLVVFSTQGPLFTVQVRTGSEWSEVRLDDAMDARDADFRLVDAAFGRAGVAAVVSAGGETGASTLYLLRSGNGIDWDVDALPDLDGVESSIDSVHSVAVGNAAVVLSYALSAGISTTAVLPL